MSSNEEPAFASLDSLNRSKEVDFVASLVRRQSEARKDHSFVLSVDAEYGIGKSFFLNLLEERLGDENPIARVDAWADDSGNEPSVSIMAAIEEALESYLDKSTAKDALVKFDRARRNILPILAKGAGGALSKAIARYVGDVVADEISAKLDEDEGEASSEATAIAEGAEAAVEAMGARLTDLADKHAKAMIADYRKRKKSRASFKKAMVELVSALSLEKNGKQAPLVVIVDELDRCRPDYAIKVLEEIKHYFDVPGVAFVLAMHRDQLSKSVRAVYGADFDSDEYLRRFFDISINLQGRNFRRLIEVEIEELGIDPNNYRWPPTDRHPANDPNTMPDYLALIFASLKVTAREAKATLRFLALFEQLWDYPGKIELTTLVPRIWASVKLKRGVQSTDFKDVSLHQFSAWLGSPNESLSLAELYGDMNRGAATSLLHAQRGPEFRTNYIDYMRLVFGEEFKALSDARETEGQWLVPNSAIETYHARVEFLDRIIDD